jgi:hypothetical protein
VLTPTTTREDTDSSSTVIKVLIPEVRRETRRRRARVLLITAAIVVAAGTIASLIESSRPHGGGSVGSATLPRIGSGLSDTLATDGAPAVEVFEYPGFTSGLIFDRPYGSSASRQYLGRGVQSNAIPGAGATNEFAVFGTQDTILYAAQNRAAAIRFTAGRLNGGFGGNVLLTTGNDVFIQNAVGDDGTDVDEINLHTKQVVHQYPLASIPTKWPPGAHCVCVGPGPGSTVASFVLDHGHLFAFQFNSYSSSVDDLTTGTSHVLPAYGDLGGGALSADGDLYVTAWRESSVPQTTTVRIFQIDPATLQVVASYPAEKSFLVVDNVQMQASPGGGVIVLVVAQQSDEASSPIHDFLWRVSVSGLHRLPLPGRGLDMRVFANSVYVFGGAARNVVSRLNLLNLSVTRDVRGLSTPTGTYVDALL